MAWLHHRVQDRPAPELDYRVGGGAYRGFLSGSGLAELDKPSLQTQYSELAGRHWVVVNVGVLRISVHVC